MNEKVYFLTGCASGIGAHMSRRLLAEGARVTVTDISADGLAQFTEHENALALPLDVRDEDAWQAAVSQTLEKWGRLDVLMNIAGVVQPAFADAVQVEDIHTQIDVNAKGTFLGMAAVIPSMKDAGGGHIINIASLASLAPISGIALYSASKHAVRAYSLAVVPELRPHNIAITLIHPDAVQTPMLDYELQHDEAAMTFSGPKILTVEDVERAIRRALAKQPLEISLPRYRGWLAKASNPFPALATFLQPFFARQGRANQRKLRG